MEPAPELVVACEERGEPQPERGQDPTELVARQRVDPGARDLRVCHLIQSQLQVGGHDHFASDRQLQLQQHERHFGEDVLEPLRLLEEEDVQRHGEAAQLLDPALVLVLHVLLGQPLQQLLGLGRDHVLAGFARGPGTGLRLRLRERLDERQDLLDPERQVRVRMETENLGRVDLGERLDELAVGRDLVRARDPVVERRRVDHVLWIERIILSASSRRQPRRGVRVEEAAVDRVRDLAAVLHFGDHVLERTPRHGAVVQVPLQKEDAGGDVARVVLVGDAPPQRAELAPLLDHGVEEAQSE
mmetsp:Transcript_15057/g.50532  ORF Transcript_15057/g.50532 Transcript_15057/m.50532 type:complete len:301 (+) Transcript_15057:747-1649(+)